MEQTLQEWTRDERNHPSEDLIYGKSLWAQINDVERVAMVMFDSFKDVVENIRVSGSHTSKSITMPVYHIDLSAHGIHVWMRDNFHDWKVSVSSERPIENVDFLDIFDPKDQHPSCYCEGMSNVFDSYHNDKRKFTVSISDSFDLAVFFRVIRRFVKTKPEISWDEVSDFPIGKTNARAESK